MHYYQFNIGDYQSHTGHLTLDEDLAYRRMLDYCYLHEKGLPKTVNEIARLIRMRGHEDAIQVVLSEYFIFNKSLQLWCQTRILENIEIWQGKSEKRKKAAKARWNKKNSDANALQLVCTSNAKQEPINKNQEPITNIDNYLANAKSEKPTPFNQIVDLYHQKLPDLPKCKKLTANRKAQIKQRHNQDMEKDLEVWADYFEFISKSAFLTGKTSASNGRSKPFIADIEWLTKESNYTKIYEGKYHNG